MAEVSWKTRGWKLLEKTERVPYIDFTCYLSIAHDSSRTLANHIVEIKPKMLVNRCFRIYSQIPITYMAHKLLKYAERIYTNECLQLKRSMNFKGNCPLIRVYFLPCLNRRFPKWSLSQWEHLEFVLADQHIDKRVDKRHFSFLHT